MSAPPPPMPPPAPAMRKTPVKASTGSNDRGALLSSIQQGTNLKKTVTKDSSAPITSRTPSSPTSASAPSGASPASSKPMGGGGPTGFGDIFASSKVQLRRVASPSGGSGGGGGNTVIEKKTATIRRGTQAVGPAANSSAGGAPVTSPSKADLDLQRDRERRAREEADLAAKAQRAAEERARAERDAAERLRIEQARKAAEEERRLAQEERARQEARAAAERAAEERLRTAAAAERERVQREERERLEKQRKAEADRARKEEEARRRAAAEAEVLRREQHAAAERATRAEQEASRARQIAIERAAAAAAAVAEAPAGTSSGGSRGFCTRCGQALRGTTVELDTKEVIHQTCFKCERCSCALNDSYFNVDGQALCEKCAKSASSALSNDSTGSPTCHSCSRKITGDYLVVDGKSLHRACLTCHDCRRELLPVSGDVSLHRWANEPGHLCTACFDKRNNAEKCDMCERPLGTGTFLTVMDKRLHPTCLRCRSCNAHVAKDRIFQKAGWPACEQCGE